MFKRVGTYWHLFPVQTQARKAIWSGIDCEGRPILEQVFPQAIRKRTSSQEMLIELVNGSTWQLTGSDNYNNLVGSNPVGVIFDEWSLCDPMHGDISGRYWLRMVDGRCSSTRHGERITAIHCIRWPRSQRVVLPESNHQRHQTGRWITGYIIGHHRQRTTRRHG